jgi:tetratricopeptide (TPR) repeat protein
MSGTLGDPAAIVKSDRDIETWGNGLGAGHGPFRRIILRPALDESGKCATVFTMKHLCFALLLNAAPVLADCPEPVDYSAEMDALFDEARQAPNDMAGQAVSAKMWQVWLRAPDEAAQEVLDKGMRLRNVYDFPAALREFDRLVVYCPDYAEGYNQRAFIHFLREDYDRSLDDLDRALALNPDHVGAQSGRALALMNLGRTDQARDQLVQALENNPWLSERFLMADGGPLAPKGKDI